MSFRSLTYKRTGVRSKILLSTSAYILSLSIFATQSSTLATLTFWPNYKIVFQGYWISHLHLASNYWKCKMTLFFSQLKKSTKVNFQILSEILDIMHLHSQSVLLLTYSQHSPRGPLQHQRGAPQSSADCQLLPLRNSFFSTRRCFKVLPSPRLLGSCRQGF